jgi:hypothetical protein
MEEAGFRDVRLYGLVIFPGWISRRLPLGLSMLESWWARLPALAPCGRLLVAVARR